MIATQIHQFKHWLQYHPSPSFRKMFLILKRIRQFEIVTPKFLNKCMYAIYRALSSVVDSFIRIFLTTPTFKGRAAYVGKRLYLYGGIPHISGPLTINIGDDCRISGSTTFSGRVQATNPTLLVGSNVDIGWQTTIAVGNQVIIEDNVRIAGRAFIFGYSGHPLDAKRRAKGEGDDENQVGDIILRKDVWLGTNVTVKSGVTIGEGTVVAAGSVVTKSFPLSLWLLATQRKWSAKSINNKT